jgi:hypothetical protein
MARQFLARTTLRFACILFFPQLKSIPIPVHCIVIGVEYARIAAAIAAVVEVGLYRFYRRSRDRVVIFGHCGPGKFLRSY